MPEPFARIPVRLTVNGQAVEREVEGRLTLADFLRQELGLTGTHLGCEHGVCGACTVLVDDRATRSCITLAVQMHGASIRTVEDLAPDGKLGPIQRAFHERHALQCGFCTPGLLTTLTQFLADTPDPTEAEAREALSGNLCRCTGYKGIIEATLLAARYLAEARGAPTEAVA
jgi:carbon-monoxide dehydrogenase small subunit